MLRSLGHPYLLLTLAALFWAGSAVIARHIAGEVPPMALNFWRWFFAFFIALSWTAGELRANRAVVLSRWKFFSFIAFTNAIGFGALHFVALQYTTAINGSLFQGMMAICILVAAWIILGDRIGPREAIGVILGFAGLGFIVTRGDFGVVLGLGFNVGDIILFAAVVSYSIYAVHLRRAPKELSSSALMTVMFGFAAVYMLPLWLGEVFLQDRPLPMSVTSLWSIAYMTVCPSVLSQIFWASAVARIGPGKAGNFIYLSPVFGVVLAVILLGEAFRWYHAAGIVLIFAGLWLATRPKTPKAPETQENRRA